MASELLPVMELPIVPLRTMVLFPHAALPMTLNRPAASRAVEAAGQDGDVAVYCAGFKGGFALDDAYCAGRIVAALPGGRTDAARAAELLARSFASAQEAFDTRTYGPPGLEADIAWCAQENLLDTVPRFVRMDGPAAEIMA